MGLPGLLPDQAEAERLYLLIEEASEVIKAATKILRHGYDSYNPDGTGSNNQQDLQRELNDFEAVHQMMVEESDVSPHLEIAISNARLRKLTYSYFQKENDHEGT